MIRKLTSLIILTTLAVTFGFGLTSQAHADQAAYIKQLDQTTFNDGSFAPARTANDGDDNVVVPEPGTIALIGLGLTSLGVLRKKKRSS